MDVRNVLWTFKNYRVKQTCYPFFPISVLATEVVLRYCALFSWGIMMSSRINCTI